jgi:hypothetical protein
MMQNRSNQLILILLIFNFFACKQRSASALSDASLFTAEQAWFTGITKPIRICVNMDPKIPQVLQRSPKDTQIAIESLLIKTYGGWLQYLIDRGIQPELTMLQARMLLNLPPYEPQGERVIEVTAQPEVRAMAQLYEFSESAPILTQPEKWKFVYPAALSFLEDCDHDQSNADLVVQIGGREQSSNGGTTVPNVMDDRESVLGMVSSQLDPAKNKLNRFMHIRGPSKILSYRQLLFPQLIMMHEWGHILGVPHVPGTVMDSTELLDFSEQLTLVETLPDRALPTLFDSLIAIDRKKILLPCYERACVVQGTWLGRFPRQLSYELKTADFKLHRDFPPGVEPIEVVKEDARNSIEVFKRPDVQEPIYHGYYTFLHDMNITVQRVFVNTNGSDDANILTKFQCPTGTIVYFEANKVVHGVSVPAYTWNEKSLGSSLEQIDQLTSCMEPEGDSPEATATRANMKEIKVQAIANYNKSRQFMRTYFESTPWTFMNPNHEPWSLPVAHTKCGKVGSQFDLCLWRNGDLGVATLQRGGLQQVIPLTRVKSMVASSGSESWGGSFRGTPPDFVTQSELSFFSFGFRVYAEKNSLRAGSERINVFVAPSASMGSWYSLGAFDK